jgi:hypothetical protein
MAAAAVIAAKGKLVFDWAFVTRPTVTVRFEPSFPVSKRTGAPMRSCKGTEIRLNNA